MVVFLFLLRICENSEFTREIEVKQEIGFWAELRFLHRVSGVPSGQRAGLLETWDAGQELQVRWSDPGDIRWNQGFPPAGVRQSGCAGEQAHGKPHSSQQPLHLGWTWEQLLSNTHPPDNRGNWPHWSPGAPGNRDLPFLVLTPELCWFLGWESIHFCSWEQLVLSLATVWLVISSLLNKSWDKEPFTH